MMMLTESTPSCNVRFNLRWYLLFGLERFDCCSAEDKGDEREDLADLTTDLLVAEDGSPFTGVTLEDWEVSDA